MAYCDICGNYDAEHTDGEPDLLNFYKHRSDLKYQFSAAIMNEYLSNQVKYDWSCTFPEINCMCEQ